MIAKQLIIDLSRYKIWMHPECVHTWHLVLSTSGLISQEASGLIMWVWVGKDLFVFCLRILAVIIVVCEIILLFSFYQSV